MKTLEMLLAEGDPMESALSAMMLIDRDQKEITTITNLDAHAFLCLEGLMVDMWAKNKDADPVEVAQRISELVKEVNDAEGRF